MGKTFRKIVLCSTDDFPSSKNDKIKGWVENNGGIFLHEMAPHVTHLVASRKAWKRYSPIVRQARRLKKVKIVNLSWLEDSLMSKTRKPLPVEKYDWEQRHWVKKVKNGVDGKEKEIGVNANGDYLLESGVEKDGQAGRDEKVKVAGEQFDNACLDFEARAKIAGYHIYTEPTAHFSYSINLVRSDIHSNRLEKHHLKIYESDDDPKTYAAFTTVLGKDGEVRHDTVAPWGSSWSLAWDCFKTFFRLRTGVEWAKVQDGRLTGVMREEDGWEVERKRALSQDGAGDFVYVRTTVQRREVKVKTKSDLRGWLGEIVGEENETEKPGVTMVVSGEVATRGGRKARPMTPAGGW